VTQPLERFRREDQAVSGDVRWKLGAAGETAAVGDVEQLTRDEECKLIQNVFRASGSASRRTVLFAGVDHHSPSATLCGRTAELLASQIEGSVCAVDADLRDPSLHLCLNGQAANGLLDLLRDGGSVRSAAQQLRANLWLLQSAPQVRDPHTVLASDRMRLLFKELREQFDYILVSAPPFSQSAESILLSQLTDGVVLVLEAHATRRERARNVKERLAAARVPVLGAVLRNRTFPIPDALYHRL
jgi:Flp pilus assembly CpaE family ATPase